MVQFGQNAGPRHLSIFGFVNNIRNKKLTQTDRTHKDRKLLGLFGLVWNLLRSKLPDSTINACETAMDAAGIPHMGTVEDSSGITSLTIVIHSNMILTDTGYTLDLTETSVTFSTAVRAPCEGYILQDYVA
jgi:hypothetical protein